MSISVGNMKIADVIVKFSAEGLGKMFLLFSAGFLAAVLCADGAMAAKSLVVSDPGVSYPLSGGTIEILEDKGGRLGITDVVSPGLSGKFKLNRLQIPNFGMTDSAFWFRFTLDNRARGHLHWLLFLDNPIAAEADLYIPDNKGTYRALLSGNARPMGIKDIADRNIVFPLEGGPSIRTYYLRLQISGRAQFPLSVMSAELFSRREKQQELLYGAYCGFMLAIAFVGLLLFLMFHDRAYLYYLFYVLGYLLFQLGMAGYLSMLFPYDPARSDFILVGVAPPLTLISLLFFVRAFLKTYQYAPRHDSLLKIMTALNAAVMLLWPITSLLVFKKLVLFNLVAGVLIVSSAAVVICRKKYAPAKYFLYSRILPYIAVAVFILGNLNLVPLPFPSHRLMLPASIADVTILIFAITGKIKLMNSHIALLASDLRKEVGVRTRANRALQTEVEERARLQGELVRVSDNERRRVSHDLHDGLCQKLTGARLYCSALENGLAENGKKMAEIEQLTRLLDESVNEAYDLSKGLWPLEHYPDRGPSLSDICVRLSERNGIPIQFSQDGPDNLYDSVRVSQLYRIGQEAITNAVKHANAGLITVSLAFSESEGIVLAVRDDGMGIQPSSGSPGGMGLSMMSHRARIIGGTLEISSAEDGGTVVICRVPPPSQRMREGV
jgi:signal transduction histidine kinase